MIVKLAIDIRLWRPGQQERLLSVNDLLRRYRELRTDEQLLQALMIDNLGCGLIVDGEIVSRCTFMYDGESSPDLLQLYEQHLPDLFLGKPVTIHFYEEMTAWGLTPAGDGMKWEVLDTSRGEAKATVEREGHCERLPFISAATDWLDNAIKILEQYQEDVRRSNGQELTPQIEMARRLLAFAREKLTSLGWRP